MESACFGFDRASQFSDAHLRRQRECFRLAARLPALAKRIELEEKVVRSQFLVVMGETGNSWYSIKNMCMVLLILNCLYFQQDRERVHSWHNIWLTCPNLKRNL